MNFTIFLLILSYMLIFIIGINSCGSFLKRVLKLNRNDVKKIKVSGDKKLCKIKYIYSDNTTVIYTGRNKSWIESYTGLKATMLESEELFLIWKKAMNRGDL